MFSDDSDLTDIETSEDEAPLASTLARKTKAKPPAAEYNVKNTLKPPRTTQYTAKSLYGTYLCPFPAIQKQRKPNCRTIDQIVDNTIDLDPEYQRGAFALSLKSHLYEWH